MIILLEGGSMRPIRLPSQISGGLPTSAAFLAVGISVPSLGLPSVVHATAQDALALLEPEAPHFFSDRFTWIVTLSLIYLVNYKFYKWVASW